MQMPWVQKRQGLPGSDSAPSRPAGRSRFGNVSSWNVFLATHMGVAGSRLPDLRDGVLEPLGRRDNILKFCLSDQSAENKWLRVEVQVRKSDVRGRKL